MNHDGRGEKSNDENNSPFSSSSSLSTKTHGESQIWQRLMMPFRWMPPWCRWRPDDPPAFSIWLNLLFGFAGAFTVANLYYNHPILNVWTDYFDVNHTTVARVPTLMQAGYAIGLFFLCPLGDLLRRRHFTVSLVFLTACLWIGLCVTENFEVFSALSFLTSVTTVTPQIMLPLVGDLAPPHRRATAVSIVVSGNVLGILIARILSGVVTQYTAWRNIYWLALGLQFFIFSLLWLFMPDYPSTNPGGINYFKMLWSVVTMGKKHAVLVQASLVSFCTSACFTSFWTTLTFLLSGPPYHYSTLVIGLFALIGIAAIALGPFYAKLFIDSFVPNVSTLIGLFIYMLGACIGAYTGKVTVAGPIIQALALDAGLQITQIANRSAIYAVEPHGRNRINTFFMLFTFIGQLTGTAAGNRLYVKSGWVATGSLNVALIAFAMLLVAVRGPYEQGWFGWRGGWTIKKRNRQTADGKTEEKSLGLARGDDKPVDIVPQDDEEKQSAQDARVLAPTQTSGARGSLNDGR